MTALAVAGFGALLPTTAGAADPGTGPSAMPHLPVHVVAGFDPRERLGRRGTSFYDRVTALAVAACDEALRDAPTGAGMQDPGDRTGVVLATTLGSFRSTSDFTRDTLMQERPYLVNPVLFPNTVMNCAAGQAAIRLGLRGVNATVAGGPVAFLHALRYATDVLSQGYADAIVVGAAEELSPHRAWSQALVRGETGAGCGEAAVAFVVTRDDQPGPPAGGRGQPRILASAAGYGPGGRAGEALTRCVRRAVARASVPTADIAVVITGETAAEDHRQYDAACCAVGHEPDHRQVAVRFGDCDAATTAVGLADLLTEHRTDPGLDGRLALLVACDADGAAAAAVVEGCDRGTHRQ